jgi:hypothetical protein
MSSHNKPTVYVPGYNEFNEYRPQLDKSEFTDSIESHGSVITVERATKCPCAGEQSGQPRVGCVNCGGFGWFFYNKRETRAVIQKVNRGNKYMSWNEIDYGKASISFRPGPNEDLSFMDRIVNMSELSEYSQILRLEEVVPGTYRAQTTFPLVSITSLFLYESENAKLRVIEAEDITFDGNTIEIVDNPILVGCPTPYSLSIRYKHNPVFHIMEITRENAITRFDSSKDYRPEKDSISKLPVHAIALRANIIFDKKTIYGSELMDNTNLTFSI